MPARLVPAKAGGFHSAITDGKNVAEARRAERAELTLDELFKQYLERHLKKSRKSWAESEKCFERFFSDWRTRRLSTITQADVERRHTDIGNNRGVYSANRAHELIRAMYNKAIAWHLYRGLNPGVGITPFEERSRERVLQSDEFEKLFNALNKEPEEDFRDFVMLTLLTGARKSNVLSMRWGDLNLNSGTWTIPAEQSRNSQSQFIVLTEGEVRILKRRRQSIPTDEPFVFPSDSESGHLTDVKHAWTSFLGRAKIENLHIHDLRRSLASWMSSTGANVAVIRSALHHKDIKTTLTVYARANRESELAARRIAQDTMLALGKVSSSGKLVPLKKREQGPEF